LELFILYLWKKKRFLLVNFILVLIAGIIYSFFIAKKEFCSRLQFLPPSSGSESMATAAIFGIQLPSLSGNSISGDQIATIFNGVVIKHQIIKKFNLYHLFKLEKSDNKFGQAAKIMKKYVILEAESKGSMGFDKIVSFSIACYHPSPDSAKLMCEYAFSLLDSSVQEISMGRAHRNKVFVDKQLSQHEQKLDSLQKAFGNFQVTNKAFAMPEQMKLSLKTYAEIKSQALLNELKMKALRQEFQGNIPELEELQKSDRLYSQKLAELESATAPEILPSFGISVKLLPQYTNLLREVEVENQVILMLSKELEQARLQESRNVSTLSVVDPAYIPEYKARPKRIVLLLLFVGIEHLLLLLIFTYRFYFSFVVAKNEKIQSFIKNLRTNS
jgi:tyrosine-protein kinase Etk/Wzc